MYKLQLIQGDCLDKLKELDSNSIDSIVTDPPYELGFMGKSWDSTGIANNKEMWAECLRVLKPGGHLLAFSGTRTYHRMASAIEDAGFEVRDMIEWVYGSGFPKSLNIGKAVDKLQGNEREVTGTDRSGSKETHKTYNMAKQGGSAMGGEYNITKGTSEWEGWGTALKPAHEPICMARKPLAEKTVAENCLKWGTGGINIDESRVETEEDTSRKVNTLGHFSSEQIEQRTNGGNIQGRFPANLIHDNSEEVRECFPERKGGGGHSSSFNPYGGNSFNKSSTVVKVITPTMGMNDSGNASRFFKSIIYQAKASKSERQKGCEGLVDKIGGGMNGTENQTLLTGSGNIRNNIMKNNHPTVKPVALMEYLIKMVTPKGGIVLDPFMGSGTTGIACRKLNRGFIGIELEEDYIKIAKARIDSIKAVQEKLL